MSIFSMLVFVFSCVTTSTVAGNSTLPLTWSPCVWVLISVVIGFGRQLFHLVEDRLTPARVLRVDDDDAVRCHEHGGVAAATSQERIGCP